MSLPRPRILPLLFAVLLLSACADQRMRTAFSENEGVRLMVGRDIPFIYDPATCQLAFSRDLREFRAHTDNMSDFFVATFVQLPSTLGQTVLADLVWTTERDVLTRKNLTLEVIRIEGDQFWLWSSTGKIGLCMRILE